MIFDGHTLQATCKNCKKQLPIKINAVSRMDLENKLGTLFHVQCPECLKKKEYHVNDVRAFAQNIGNSVFIFIIMIIIAFSILALLAFGLIGIATFSLPLFIYGLLKNNQNSKITTFNKHYITREKPYYPPNPKRL